MENVNNFDRFLSQRKKNLSLRAKQAAFLRKIRARRAKNEPVGATSGKPKCPQSSGTSHLQRSKLRGMTLEKESEI
jgi:hypothetical protein